MRGRLFDVAGGLAAIAGSASVAARLHAGRIAEVAARILDARQGLVAVTRAARGRLREQALRAATSVPGSGGDAVVGAERRAVVPGAGRLRFGEVRGPRSCRSSLIRIVDIACRSAFARWAASGIIAAVALLSGCGSMESRGGTESLSPRDLSQLVAKKITVSQARDERLSRSGARFCGARDISKKAVSMSDIRLIVNPSVVSSGQPLNARLENLGDVDLGYGPVPMADKLVAGGWRRQVFTEGGRPVGFPSIELSLPAHSLSSCLSVPVPREWGPGLYRLRFSVEGSGRDSGHPQPAPTAYFKIRRPKAA